MKTLGFIGTGGMGSGMAANLIKAGNKLIINDLRREQAKGLESQGAVFKESPKAVAESATPNQPDLERVRLGQSCGSAWWQYHCETAYPEGPVARNAPPGMGRTRGWPAATARCSPCRRHSRPQPARRA